MSKRIVIVGGGISGLSAAYFLTRKGFDCTLIEEQQRLGGVILTERIEGCLVESGPDSFISQKPWALELIRELGLGDEVIGSNDRLRKTYIVRGGRLIPIPDGLQMLAPTKIRPVLTSPLFGPVSKVRMALELLRRPGPRKPERSVAEFVREHYGWEMNEYLAQPLLAGVYGGSPESLSVDSVLPRFVELERKYGSVSRGALAERRKAATPGAGAAQSLFLTLKSGMSRLTGELARRIEGRVRRITAPARRLERDPRGGWKIGFEGGETSCDEAIFAVPAWRAAEIVRAADEALAELLFGITYNSSITAALIYDQQKFARPLDGFGFLVPRKEKGHILSACTWVNTKFDCRAAEGRVLLRAFLSGDRPAEVKSLADEKLIGRVHAELSRVMGFAPGPLNWRVRRWDRAMAIYSVGHRKRIEGIAEKLRGLRGLHLGGNGYEGIGIPDCIRRSREIAERIAG